jgi:type IV fimbrial biogenesis protein FimT
MFKSVHKNSGFSLMELMTVVAIIAVLAAFAIPNMIGARSRSKLQGVVDNLTGDLRLAKLMAIRESSFVVVDFAADSYRLFIDDNEDWDSTGERTLQTRQLPPDVRIDLAATDLSDDRTRFNDRGLPDDTNLGTVVIVNSAGDQRSININRLGRVRVQP